MPSFTAQAGAIPRLWAYSYNTVIATVKDPKADENFSIDWTTALNGDTIKTSNWEMPVDIQSTRPSTNTTTGTTGCLAGGILGETYFVVNTVLLTTSGQTLVQNFDITIQSV